MPRIKQNYAVYSAQDLKRITDQKRVGIYNQEELGQRLGMSQQSFSKKLKNGKFVMKELQALFKELEFTDEEILKVMKLY